MKRKAMLVLGTLAALVGGAAWFGQRPFGDYLFDRAVEDTVGRDRTASYPDGIHAFLCGSGSPFPDAERAGPCIAVLAGKQAFVFDAGSGSIRKLQRMGFPMDRLQAAFLTHLHSDHIDGFGELMLQAWVAGGRDKPLPVYGPQGTDRVVEGFMAAYRADRGYRIAHHGADVVRPGGFGGEVRLIDPALAGAPIYNREGVSISAIPVDHKPVDHAFAYRIDYGGRSMVISGDTRQSANLARFAQGANVLFHEALNPRMVGKIGSTLAERGDADGAKIMADIPDYHTTPEQAAEVANQAGVKALVLYHLVPAPPVRSTKRAFLGNAPDLFDGELRIGDDGLLVSLPTKGEAIQFTDLL